MSDKSGMPMKWRKLIAAGGYTLRIRFAEVDGRSSETYWSLFPIKKSLIEYLCEWLWVDKRRVGCVHWTCVKEKDKTITRGCVTLKPTEGAA